MDNNLLPNADYLHTVVGYNARTGDMFWKERPVDHFKSEASCKRWNTRFAGKTIKTISSHGYIRFSIDYRLHLAHRVAFVLMTGKWPDGEVDHINHDKTDNRWDNLRIVDRCGQMQNTSISKNNTSGFNGVSWCGQRKKWIAMITVGNHQMNLGGFSDKNDAVAARLSADKLYSFHENHGNR